MTIRGKQREKPDAKPEKPNFSPGPFKGHINRAYEAMRRYSVRKKGELGFVTYSNKPVEKLLEKYDFVRELK